MKCNQFRPGFELVSPCPYPTTITGTSWKCQYRKNVYLSPYVEEPLNSKVIISFVPELRSRKCFSCFGILMFYVYMFMNILCTFHISVSGYGTSMIKFKFLTQILVDHSLLLFWLYNDQREIWKKKENHRSVEANVLDCDVEVSEFDLLSRYYIPFQTNASREGMTPTTYLSLLAMGWISTTTVLRQDRPRH